MLERCGYRAALYLLALIATVNFSLFIYSQWYLPRLGDGLAIHTVAALVILLGLWLFSKIARYAGAVFYFLSAGSAAFAFWDFAGPVHAGVIWGATIGVLSLAAALILVFSKPFAREFAAEREKRPEYKKYLLHAFTFAVVVAAGAGALVDVVALFSSYQGQ
ncbi:hypothetical protein [Bradyrhizobium icense]|uniref:Uncharacterized protein n=1 Tax=Bradyrhizobium icense TaxID=1274631 RepID=A0A1B1U9V6_9BRAD|nr:hypothetical protein [Bradyrhizobium icense]ANV99544.1 hypothetical protein LMTR13_04465 [Bradyrhizobium icense]